MLGVAVEFAGGFRHFFARATIRNMPFLWLFMLTNCSSLALLLP